MTFYQRLLNYIRVEHRERVVLLQYVCLFTKNERIKESKGYLSLGLMRLSDENCFFFVKHLSDSPTVQKCNQSNLKFLHYFCIHTIQHE